MERYKSIIEKSRQAYIKKNMQDMDKAIEESQNDFLLVEQ